MSTDEKVDAWMPLWIGAYLADTMKLTTLQHGGYLLLLIAYWRNRGPLDDDDEELASTIKASPAEWRKLRPKLERFFDVADGKWSHGRAEKELAAAGLRKAAAVSKAQKGAAARWKKSNKDSPEDPPSDAPSMPEALPGHCPTPSPTPLPSGASEANASAAGAAAGPVDKSGAGVPPPPPKVCTPEEQSKAQLWRAAVAVLDEGGCRNEDVARSFMGKLVADYTVDIVRDAVAAAATAQPADAREYLTKTCQRLKGERRADTGKPLTVPSTEPDATQQLLAEQSAHATAATGPPENVREQTERLRREARARQTH